MTFQTLGSTPHPKKINSLVRDTVVLLQIPSSESVQLSFCYWRYLWLYPLLTIVSGGRNSFSQRYTPLRGQSVANDGSV